MSKFLSAAALVTAALSSPAFADVGLETGTGGYSVVGSGTFSAASTSSIAYDDASYGFTYNNTVSPAVGGYFGVLTTDDSLDTPTTLTYTFSKPTTTSDVLYVRLTTADAYVNQWDDPITVSLYNASDVAYFQSTYTASEFFNLTGQAYFPDSGWMSFSVASGTSKFSITIGNSFESGNAPTAYVDYFATPAVPEPSNVVLALAGLVGLGMMARRRSA